MNVLMPHAICSAPFAQRRPAADEHFLEGASPDVRSVLLHCRLALEVEFLRSAGERIEMERFLRRFPDDAHIIHDVSGVPSGRPGFDGSAVWPAIRYYDISEQLSGGGMGTVYRASHILLSKAAAVKALRPETLPTDLADGLFEEEIHNVGQLQHPDVVQALFAGIVDGRRCLVLELVHGLDMARVVENRSATDWRWV